ncbi:DUF4157 domain-containing protein [Paeniglutamicibacter kerguelensis]|uniref:DUF4157 domain-containing protein n=1 Tax=Paeniglutamicibacter kerguelensis TaxID=254788 RepID=A0ABS4XAH8_9MICC|nr:DUF4157 domain-containing protein [Paeniglutamicibacter kerguelensis]MBP2385253.1 hypothetical protein [Paeniglutamicibacter kerguelensis]
MGKWESLRAGLNWLNLSTLSGLALARCTGCRVKPGQQGLIYALNYRPRLPVAGAFTVGNVVFFRKHFSEPGNYPQLLEHEATHSTQYALCMGLPFIPLYFLAAGYSWLRIGDPASRNVFERRANLQGGGYTERPVRRIMPQLAHGLRRAAHRGVTQSPNEQPIPSRRTPV